MPDIYSYDYEGHRVAGLDPGAPTIRCRPLGPVPLPGRVAEVVWRAGIDLEPLDVTSDEDVEWLSCLPWPGEDGRAERLEGAVSAARKRPPVVHRADLLDDLGRVAVQAPGGATLVVYHSAVLAYADKAKRAALGAEVRAQGAVWLSNEGDGVLRCLGVDYGDARSMLLVRYGHDVLARTDPHGTWVEWSG